jgi:uncharacterized protein with HEPN domain
VHSRSIEEYLRDIIENFDTAKAFVVGKTHADFAKDRLTHYAVLRALEIVSEASRHLTAEIKTRHPKIKWRAIADAGNVYRHVYHKVDLEFVWQTVTEFLDPIRAAAAAELKRLKG